MYGLIDDIWERFAAELNGVAENLYLPTDTPNDKLLLMFIAYKCDVIQIADDEKRYVDDMMNKVVLTGKIEGEVTTALNNPEFMQRFF